MATGNVNPIDVPAGVEFERAVDGDIYLGKPDALIAAGLLTVEQVPGWPGMPPTSATFVNGLLKPRGGPRAVHDEHWMQVTRIGGNIRLTKGIPAEEKRKRTEARQAEIEEAERNKPKTDIGFDGARKAYDDASTLHKVGDRVWIDDHPVVVTGEYKLRYCWSNSGEFHDARTGRRFDYRYGYTCQYRNGEEFFWPASSLTDEDGCLTHLRLVRGGA